MKKLAVFLVVAVFSLLFSYQQARAEIPDNDRRFYLNDYYSFYSRPRSRGRNWIRITGRVKRFFGDTIILDTGRETVRVDVDDLNIDEMGDLIEVGDELLVIGELDDDGLKSEIEAWRIHAVTDYGTIVMGR